MRQGNNPEMLLNEHQQIFALATGSDFTAEHEGGMAPILETLTDNQAGPARTAAKNIMAGRQRTVGNLAKSRRLSANLELVEWREGVEDGEPIAGFVFAPDWSETPSLNHVSFRKELSFGRSAPRDRLAACWDEGGFAFLVKGEQAVRQLKEFYDALQAGDVMFAGTFLASQRPRLSGIVMCRVSLMNEEQRKSLEEAQDAYVKEVALYMASRHEELMNLPGVRRQSFLHIWPVWADDKNTAAGVHYRINTGGRVAPNPAPVPVPDGHGRYTFESLSQWLA